MDNIKISYDETLLKELENKINELQQVEKENLTEEEREQLELWFNDGINRVIKSFKIES